MNKTIIGFMLVFAILITALMWQVAETVKAEQTVDKLEIAQQPQTIEAPYTMITNLSSSMYINSVTIPSDAVHWTDTNGVSGFDVTVGTTHYRYVEGHVEPMQINLYAPYLYVEENIFN
jgi:hypothetical protein